MNIDKQYDNEGMANEYAKESMETKENDLGRIFLSEQISKNDKSSFILDIGCGSGIDLESYKEIGFTNLYGIDPSINFLNEAKEILGNNINLSEGTFENIPFEDKKFDVVVSRFALHYCKDIFNAQKEVARVLKRGGKFIVVMANPTLDSIQEVDNDGNITMSLFKGKVFITYPPHTLSDIFSDDFFNIFELTNIYEYLGVAVDNNTKKLPDGLCFIAIKK